MHCPAQGGVHRSTTELWILGEALKGVLQSQHRLPSAPFHTTPWTLPPACLPTRHPTLQKVMQLLRSTESAVRTFQRSKLWRDAPQQYKGEE